MNTALKNRLIRTLILALIGLIAGGGIAYYQIQNDVRYGASRDVGATAVPGVKVGGDFTLTNHLGERQSISAWGDQYKLIYFGFTYCPAICPTELQKISAVLNRLDDEQAAKIQPIFITIDPERDNVATMKDYISLFHPKLVGFTGGVQEIDAVKKDYRVFAAKTPIDDGADYTMDHSSYIYLMSPDNTLISIYRIQDDVKFILSDLKEKGLL